MFVKEGPPRTSQPRTLLQGFTRAYLKISTGVLIILTVRFILLAAWQRNGRARKTWKRNSRKLCPSWASAVLRLDKRPGVNGNSRSACANGASSAAGPRKPRRKERGSNDLQERRNLLLRIRTPRPALPRVYETA